MLRRLFLTIVLSLLMSQPGWGYDEADLQRLLKTNSCRGCDLSNADLAYRSLDRANLTGTNLSETNLRNSYLNQSNLAGANLAGANLAGANLTEANLTGANLTEADLSGASMKMANFTGANLTQANLTKAFMFRSNLWEAVLTRADLSGANLIAAIDDASTVWPVGFEKPTSSSGYCHGDIQGYFDAPTYYRSYSCLGTKVITKQEYENSSQLNAASLPQLLETNSCPGCDLSEVNLSSANLAGANLSSANLSSANLSSANLAGANLTEANLVGAVLIDANLTATNLYNADLRGANLTEANLTGAELSDAYLANAIVDAFTIWPKGFERPKELASSPEPTTTTDYSKTIYCYRPQDGYFYNSTYLTECVGSNLEITKHEFVNRRIASATDLTGFTGYCYRTDNQFFYKPVSGNCSNSDRNITKQEFDNRRLSESTSATLTAQSTTAPSSEEVTPVPTQTEDTSLELQFWRDVTNSDSPDMYRAYLEEFPEGKFVLLAKLKLKELTGATETIASAIPDLDYGRYHALVIGNNDYDYLKDLKTAINDAEGVASLLKEDYGFEVSLLKNATRVEIVDALVGFRKTVSSNDSLLIYYAGHGHLDEAADEGYWLPVDADTESPSNWIQNGTIVAQVRAMDAKHVMIVADSCFSGTLTRAIKIELRTPSDLQKIIQKKARTALTSGGLEPVLDSRGGDHSVFAKSFISLLEDNPGVLDAHQLFSSLRTQVALNSSQIPEYGNIHEAGHDGGDFLFVKTAKISVEPATASSIEKSTVEAVPNNAAEVAFWQSIEDSDDADEIREYLKQFPQGTYAGLAKVKIKKLESPVETIAEEPQQVFEAPVDEGVAIGDSEESQVVVEVPDAELDSEIASNIKKLLESRSCRGCNLVGADLRSVDLRDVDLTGANLTGANLSGANLIGADLTGVILAEARNISEATFCNTTMPDRTKNNTGCEPVTLGEIGPWELILFFDQGSWADVRDARDRQLLRESVRAGTTVRLKGDPPFTVFVGNARGVRYLYRGEEKTVPTFGKGLFSRFQVGVSE